MTDEPAELGSLRSGSKWWEPVLTLGAVAALGGLGMWMFGGPSTCDVIVETTPADARVTIDGKPLSGSQSPFSAEKLLVGAHALSVQKPGFTDHTQTFNLDGKQSKHTVSVKLNAAPPKNKADLTVSSLPPGAAIIVDGQPSGLTTPAAVNLNYGYHTVQLRLDGYAEGEKVIKVPDESALSISLNPAQPTAAGRAGRGSSAYTPASPASLGDDGAAAKRSALRAAKIRTKYRANRGMFPRPEDAELIESVEGASSPWLSMSGSTGASASSRTSSRSSRSSDSSSSLYSSSRSSRSKDTDDDDEDFGAPSKSAAASGGHMGTLQVNSRPWAEIYLDGQHIGHTPLRGAQVPAGRHTLKLTNPGMDMSKTLTINVVAGQTLTKIENLAK